MLRLVTVGIVLIALVTAAKDHRVLQRAHLLGSCSTYALAEDGSEWLSCIPGRLSGRPSLELTSCTDFGRRGTVEVWNCPAALDDRAPRE